MNLHEEGDTVKSDKEPKMFKIHKKSSSSVDYYWKKFKCIDEQISLIGDF